MFTLGIQIQGRYVLMSTSGPCGHLELTSSISFLASMLQGTGHRKALVDLLALDFHLSHDDDVTVFEHLVDFMPKLDAVAVVVPRTLSHHLVHKAAEQSGILAQEFDTLSEAEQWLETAGGFN